MRGTVRQDDHRVRWARVALAGNCRASAAAGSRGTSPQGVPTCADFGKETEVDDDAQPSVAWTVPPEGAEASFQVGHHRAAFVVGLALHFALSASPCGLRRATLRAKPTGQKNRDPIGRPRRGSSFLRLASEKFFKSNSRKKQKRGTKRKKGTFLMR